MWPIRTICNKSSRFCGTQYIFSHTLRQLDLPLYENLETLATLRRGIWSEADQSHGGTSTSEAERPLDSFYDNTVETMLDFGRDVTYKQDKILTSARYVHRELPRRLARRLLDLQFLPYVVVTNPHIRRVYHAYFHAFNILRGVPIITTWQENATFSQLLRRLVDEHAPMLDALASGLRECSRKPIVGEQLKLDGFLDNMLRSRISRRVIAEQHINLQNTMPGFIGCFQINLNVVEAAEFAAQRVQQVCRETYGVSPDVRVLGDTQVDITYIPTHLDYMLYELLKNSVRAVVEFHKGATRIPPVVIHVCSGSDCITIRVMDQGGGIPEADLQRVWQYGYTTIADGPSSHTIGASSSGSSGRGGGEGLGGNFGDMWSDVAKYSAGAARYRMAGLGFGLPLSRLYARYFGGDLKLVSMPGYGVDAYLHIKRLDNYSWEEHTEGGTSS